MRVWWVPLWLAWIWSRPGYVQKYKVDWRIKPRHGLWTIVRIERI